MSFFGTPPLRARVGADEALPPAPAFAPALWDVLGGAPVPILVWVTGPNPPDLYRSFGVGWCYDAAGNWWEVSAPSTTLKAYSPRYDGVYRGPSGFIFRNQPGPPPDDEGPDLISQVGEVFVRYVIPAAIGILTIVQPGIGIAAALVYSKVVLIASGAPLSKVAFSAMKDAVKSQIPSTTGKSLFEQGVAAAGNTPQVEEARKKIDAFGKSAAETLGLKQALESGVAIGQSKLIQERAVQILRAKLPTDHEKMVLDNAVTFGAAITDVALGMFPTPATGAAELTAAIAQAATEIDPNTKTIPKKIIAAKSIAQSGLTVARTGIMRSGSSSGGGSSSSGVGTVVVVGALGYGAYKLLPTIKGWFSK